MATADTIIQRALRLIKVLASGEAMDAAMGQDSLAVLNALLAEWHEAEIGLPDYSFASLTTALDSDDADAEAIAHQLAIRIAPEYDRDISPLIASNAQDSMARMRLRYFQPGSALIDLPTRTASLGITDFTSGNF